MFGRSMTLHEFGGTSLVNQAAISAMLRHELQKSSVGAEFTSLSIPSLNQSDLRFPCALESTSCYFFRNAMRSLRSSAFGTLKLILLSGTIRSGSLNHFSSVASFQVTPEFFKPLE